MLFQGLRPIPVDKVREINQFCTVWKFSNVDADLQEPTNNLWLLSWLQDHCLKPENGESNNDVGLENVMKIPKNPDWKKIPIKYFYLTMN